MFVSVKHMVRAEQRAIKQLLIPESALMYNAGKHVFDSLLDKYPDIKNIGIAAGFGNNAGDGFVTAMLLHNKKKNVRIVSLGHLENFSNSAGHFFQICQKQGIDIKLPDGITNSINATKSLADCDVIIDALLGTGFVGTVSEPIASVISSIPTNIPIIAVDIPSGLNGSTGEVGNVCIRASQTITFARPKIGMKNREEYTGKVAVADIGIPDICFDDEKWFKLTHSNL